MLSGEAFWDAYEKFDFEGLESEIRSETLAASEMAEAHALGWGFVTLSAVAAEVITGSWAIAERSSQSISLLALSSLAMIASGLRTRYWGNQADSIPNI